MIRRTVIARTVIATVVAAGVSSCGDSTGVADLYERAGGQEWCGGELEVAESATVATCGGSTGVVLQDLSELDELGRDMVIAGNWDREGYPMLVADDGSWKITSIVSTDLLRDAQDELGGDLLLDECAMRQWAGLDTTGC